MVFSSASSNRSSQGREGGSDKRSGERSTVVCSRASSNSRKNSSLVGGSARVRSSDDSKRCRIYCPKDALRPWRVVRAHSRNVFYERRRHQARQWPSAWCARRKLCIWRAIPGNHGRGMPSPFGKRRSRFLSGAPCPEDRGLDGSHSRLFLSDPLNRRRGTKARTAVLNDCERQQQHCASNQKAGEEPSTHG
jgi:hypothetical protein